MGWEPIFPRLRLARWHLRDRQKDCCVDRLIQIGLHVSGHAHNLSYFPVFVADDVLEFHAARLLLLIQLCGTVTRGEGLARSLQNSFSRVTVDGSSH